ncbi:hypothetical protein KUTeg_022248 [Tegillarca granosa]|uniref:C2H2-type domain-containing protein n=1 Tax=Tegillarca granosa TaxID=220873 RepID=A0ABQ9E5V3_TEGGR|nr:hypothetical protein KUTeg_022248 [Tegillarca granosa]
MASPSKKSRNEKIAISKCSNSLHKTWNSSDDSRLERVNKGICKKFTEICAKNKENFEKLDCTRKSKYKVCRDCVKTLTDIYPESADIVYSEFKATNDHNYSQKITRETNKNENGTHTIQLDFIDFSDELDLSNISEKNLERLAFALERNSVLTSFIDGLASDLKDNSDEKLLYAKCKAIESKNPDLKPSNWSKNEEIKATINNASRPTSENERVHLEELVKTVNRRIDISKRVCANVNCKANLKQLELQAIGDLGTYEEKEANSAKWDGEVRINIKKLDDSSYEFEQTKDCDMETAYNDVPHGHPESPYILSLTEPIFVNPNSYDSVMLILKSIGIKAGIKQYGTGNREWISIVCDGLPYGLCIRVIRDSYRCLSCYSQETFFGNSAREKHANICHNNAEPEFKKEFEWVVLRPGLGHYEMNMCKSFIKLNWDCFMSGLAKVMGFRNDNAQKAAKNCNDHHKSMSLLQIAFFGCLDQLLVPYGLPVFAEDFLYEFIQKEVKNPTYGYVVDQILTYGQSILNFRKGVRRNNASLIKSGIAVHAPIFFGRNHQKYMKIFANDAFQNACAPDEIQEFFNLTNSLNGNPDSGEGLDFKLEVVNKDIQAWIPRGVPKSEDWLRAVKNLAKLKELKHKYENEIGVTKSSIPKKSKFWHGALNREKRISYLISLKESVNISLLKAILWIQNSDLATKRRDKFYMKFVCALESGQKLPYVDTHPIYVTPEERAEYNKVENKTIEELRCDINASVSSILDSVMQECFNFRIVNELPKSKKAGYISLYNDICDHICEQNALVVDVFNDEGI